MAERRMISKKVFSSDKFTTLPAKAKLLYAYMILYSDDQGFSDSVKLSMTVAGASKSDLRKLIDAGYVIQFDSGAYLIAHWPLMNKVQPSRATETSFSKELDSVIENADHVYVLWQGAEEQTEEIRRQIADDLPTKCQQNADKMSDIC